MDPTPDPAAERPKTKTVGELSGDLARGPDGLPPTRTAEVWVREGHRWLAITGVGSTQAGGVVIDVRSARADQSAAAYRVTMPAGSVREKKAGRKGGGRHA